jgi:hypothetical protein
MDNEENLPQRTILKLESFFSSRQNPKLNVENRLHLKEDPQILKKKLCAQRLALAAWWGDQPAKRKKAPRRDGGFFAARTTKSACTHC